MIPPTFIQDLLTRADIVEVVGRHVQLKKAGINYKGLCPFHGEKTPSFIVSPTRQTYHCFGCGVHGNAVGFLMEHGGLGFVDAVKDLAQQFGLQVPEDETAPEQRAQAAQQREKQATLTEVMARATDHYRRQLKASPRAVAYLKQRGLTGEIAARFALGYAPEGWRGLAGVFPRYDDPLLAESGLVIVQGEDEAEQKRYDRFRDRIMFPIRNVKGEVIGFGGRVLDQGEPKYLNSPETPVFVKGRELYGLYEARGAMRASGYALVVEGYMDVVALAQLGFENAVATLGTACTAEHVQKLFRFTDSVVFSFDGDAAGRRAAARALEAALPHASDTRSVRFLFLPPEHDPDSYVREHGAEAFALCVAQAVPLSRQLVDTAREACDLGTPEGRARMLAQAKPMWSALPAGAFRQQMLAELAGLGGLEPGDLLQHWEGAPPSAVGRPRGEGERGAARGGGGSGGGGGSSLGSRRGWKDRRGEPPRQAPLKSAPLQPADHAARMLLLHSDWWDRLTAEDHELLHALPAPHGPLCAWLERQLGEHGPQPWAVLAQALEGDELEAAAQRLVGSVASEDVMNFEDLRAVVNRMLVKKLNEEMQHLIANAGQDPGALQRYRELLQRCGQLKLPVGGTAAAGPGSNRS
ncbi:DNA primase [Caldimonas tepidiphila]|uniref:DNA primase n=1 Tax=Caldimonas tepidiphila TaxID=2315841 RepID=UPI000E5AFCD5|nr:DNA primase [Caldimonas tepidiphila]